MPDQPPGCNAERQVTALQRDGLLLVAYLAERPDRQLVQNGAEREDTVQLSLLTAPAAEVAADAAKFGALLKTIDSLARSAEPATTATIRVTSDYLFGTPDLACDRARLARRAPTRKVGLILAAMLLVTGLAVWLLAQVDEGRRAMAQLATVNTDLARVFAELGKLDAKDWVPPEAPAGQEPKMVQAQFVARLPSAAEGSAPKPAPFTDYCEPDPPRPGAGPGAPQPFRAPATAQAQELCSQLARLRLREALVYASLTEWNCAMFRLRPATWLGGGRDPAVPAAEQPCLRPPFAPTPPASAEHWQRTELRTAANITMLSGYVLPVLLGMLGGCVYVLRRMSYKVDTWTLAAKDGTAGLVRIMLAGACGGLLGLIFGTEAAVALGGFSLSLAAWAFFLGYALETVLQLLDTVVRAVVERLQPPESRKEVPVTARAA